MSLKVFQIKSSETYGWLLKKHYAKRIPNIVYAFGLYDNTDLTGVVTYGIPPSDALCRGVCGSEHKAHVIELNRLCLEHNRKNEASFLVAHSLHLLPKPKIVVSYADTSKNHVGYIYQATNFLYTGLSAKRDEWRVIGSNKHSKTITAQSTLKERKENKEKFEVVERPRKHRYIYFVGNKKQKKLLKLCLNYKVKPYPKGDNLYYDSSANIEKQIIFDLGDSNGHR